MTLEGRVTNIDDPMTISVRGMLTVVRLVEFHTNNIAYADTPGYQRKKAVITSFAEHLGPKGVDTAIDTSIGRIHNTLRHLDCALNTPGYFQKLHKDGRVEITRDGRFRLDKEGNLLSVDHMPILSSQGTPIKLPFVPDKLDRIKIKVDGTIELLNPADGKTERVAQLGIAAQDGTILTDVDIRQGHVEESNVFLHEEYTGLVGQGFQANRQMFLTQSQVLSRLIQEMGKAQ
jgi:flagellar basal-body rod protein FlgF